VVVAVVIGGAACLLERLFGAKTLLAHNAALGVICCGVLKVLFGCLWAASSSST